MLTSKICRKIKFISVNLVNKVEMDSSDTPREDINSGSNKESDEANNSANDNGSNERSPNNSDKSVGNEVREAWKDFTADPDQAKRDIDEAFTEEDDDNVSVGRMCLIITVTICVIALIFKIFI